MALSKLRNFSSKISASQVCRKVTALKKPFRKLMKQETSTMSASSTLVVSGSSQSAIARDSTVSSGSTVITAMDGTSNEAGLTISKQLATQGLISAETEVPAQILRVDNVVEHAKLVKLRTMAKTAFAVILFVNEGLAAASDACPPVKSAAGGLIHIVNVNRKMKDDVKEIRELQHWIEELGKMLEGMASKSSSSSTEVQQAISEFKFNTRQSARRYFAWTEGQWAQPLHSFRKTVW